MDREETRTHRKQKLFGFCFCFIYIQPVTRVRVLCKQSGYADCEFHKHLKRKPFGFLLRFYTHKAHTSQESIPYKQNLLAADT